jgi:hypothetical protein
MACLVRSATRAWANSSERYIFTCLNKITRTLFPASDDAILQYLNDKITDDFISAYQDKIAVLFIISYFLLLLKMISFKSEKYDLGYLIEKSKLFRAVKVLKCVYPEML